MPSYVIVEPMGDSPSLLIEKFLVSIPVLATLLFGVLYVIHQLLELDEDLLLDLNSGQDTEEDEAAAAAAAAEEDQSIAEPVGGRGGGGGAAAEGEPLEEGAEGGGGGAAGGGESGEELDPREEGLFEELARKFSVLCMLLEEALFSDRYDNDAVRSGIEPTTEKKKKKKTDEEDPKTMTTAEKEEEEEEERERSLMSANEQQQVPRKTDQLSGRVGQFNRRPHLVTSVEDNGFVVVVRDDVTAIPVQVVPSSVEISVAPADQQVGEKSCGCCAAAAAAAADARRCPSAAQRCRSKSCLRRDGLPQQRLGDDDDAAPEADRAPLSDNPSSTLRFSRQTTDVEALIGRLRELLCQHDNTGSEDDHVCTNSCDVVEVFPSTACCARAGLADQERRRRRRSLLCCGNRDVVVEGSNVRKPGHCICVVVKLDRSDFDCQVEARETRRKSTACSVSPRVLVETADAAPDTTPTRCGCSRPPHAASRTFAPRVIIVSESRPAAD